MRVCQKTLLLFVGVAFLSLVGGSARAGTIFGLKSLAPGGVVPSAPPTHLFRFDDNVPGSVTDLGAVLLGGQGVDADGLAWSAAHGLLAFQLAGAAAPSSSLISIDRDTATATQIGNPLVGHDIRGATFDAKGDLWVVDAMTDQFLKIDPADGSILATVDLVGFDVMTVTDIAQRRDGSFYLTDVSSVYTVDITTGDVTSVHAFPDDLNALAGISFSTDGPDNVLFGYEVDYGDDIYAYNVDDGFSRTDFQTYIIPSFNSGRGDLAALTQETPTVPVPGAIVLTGVGATLVGWMRRRRTR